MSNLDLALIGNCSIAALLDKQARVVWCCLPRFDGDPVFCSLLNNGREDLGFFEIELLGFVRAEQFYRRNSAILVTRLYDGEGGAIEITDFAPRFKRYGRIFRPIGMARVVRPIAGTPRIRIKLRPSYDYGSHRAEVTRGSNHIRYIMPRMILRLTTDAPIAYIVEEVPFLLEAPLTLVLGPDESLTSSPGDLGHEFLDNTDAYWREWCRYLSLPYEWQDAVIRAAITLKLCNYEESGAIVAALTTSIPEAANSGRNWDYRYCWLRDSFFVVHALNRLGATQTMEGYLNYVSNIAAAGEDGYLQPLFGITLDKKAVEIEQPSLAGYRGMGPVRTGNGAYIQIQNDGYGSVILSIAQMFFDQRLTRMGDPALFRRLERIGEQAAARWNQPDAGPWELRTRKGVHTYSGMISWAGCDRLARIANRLGLQQREAYWGALAEQIKEAVLTKAWNESRGTFAATFEGDEVDANLLVMPQLGLISAKDPRFLATLDAVEKQLRHGKHMYRYIAPDDFGRPETSFTVCTFWLIDALHMVGREDEARELFENMLACRTSLGLLSEDIDVRTGELWGNFPQTYSMVGLIQSAMRLSKPWTDAF
ncbi:MAG: glucoamylase [Alphaproteobacteria bacterium]|nr:MAG: glucoamylase [Alphaproteobacteria bacterium]